jgi:hypothetical protein
MGEHIGVRRQRRPAGEGVLDLSHPAGPQLLDGGGAHRNPALGVGLGVLVDQRLPGDADHIAGDQHLATVEVDIRPAQAANLSPAGAEDDREPQEQA